MADCTKSNIVALKKGNVEVNLRDNRGEVVRSVLENALYIPFYPQDIFSVTTVTVSMVAESGHRIYFQ